MSLLHYCLGLHKFSFRLMAARSLQFRSSIRQWACSTARDRALPTGKLSDSLTFTSRPAA
ncbi:hypothetical protein PVAP13_5KG530507 [Panicum virgatum]|uniref:Uncharacterized protein n=1 Tax=Panicum virgatum TaxID=38727 RepID=A0A8T0SLX8_PANVG|nr:hypothetical protein PVAP13_5KG530507 [Panicum virgatum]